MLSINSQFAGAIDQTFRDMRVHLGNVSNSDVPGFKRLVTAQQAGFVTELHGASGPIKIPSHAVNAKTYQDLSNGELENTGNPLHLALQTQNAYFAVIGTDGERKLVRAGIFGINKDRRVYHVPTNLLVEGIDAIPEEVDTSTVEVDERGLMVGQNNLRDNIEVGRVLVYGVGDPDGLKESEAGTFVTSEESGDAFRREDAPIISRNIEKGNSNGMEAILAMQDLANMTQALVACLTKINETYRDSVNAYRSSNG